MDLTLDTDTLWVEKPLYTHRFTAPTYQAKDPRVDALKIGEHVEALKWFPQAEVMVKQAGLSEAKCQDELGHIRSISVSSLCGLRSRGA